MKKLKIPTAFGWVGVMNDKIDLAFSLSSAYPPIAYGLVYPTRKEARRFYERVRRVMVKPY